MPDTMSSRQGWDSHGYVADETRPVEPLRDREHCSPDAPVWPTLGRQANSLLNQITPGRNVGQWPMSCHIMSQPHDGAEIEDTMQYVQKPQHYRRANLQPTTLDPSRDSTVE